jgi:hypothetical protein
MALGSTQTLTEMSITNPTEDKERLERNAEVIAICEPIV